ncbi:MAG TPA: TonB family protein [Chthoniobacterales bacterium]
MAKPILYRPPSKNLLWAAFGCTAVIYASAVVAAIKHEAPTVDLADIPQATVEASIEQAEEQPTPPPEDIPVPEPPPMPQEVPEFHEENTPPPKHQPNRPTAPIKTPQVGTTGPKTLSISGAKALAINSPRPEYPYEARSRHIMGSGVCVVSVDMGSGSVTDATMAQSIGNPILDNAAVSAFRRWRFKPGTVSKVKIPITFTMAGASY